MIRTTLNDRYIKSAVVFQSEGDSATMSYFGQPTLPINAQYEFEDKKWRVVSVQSSKFNPQVVNVDLAVVIQEN